MTQPLTETQKREDKYREAMIAQTKEDKGGRIKPFFARMPGRLSLSEALIEAMEDGPITTEQALKIFPDIDRNQVVRALVNMKQRDRATNKASGKSLVWSLT